MSGVFPQQHFITDLLIVCLFFHSVFSQNLKCKNNESHGSDCAEVTVLTAWQLHTWPMGSPSDWPFQMNHSSLITCWYFFLPMLAVLLFFSPSVDLNAPLSPSCHLFISRSISLTSAHLTASLSLSLHCNKTLVWQFMYRSPRPESSPATIASRGSWQWVAAIHHRCLRLKLHTLRFRPSYRPTVLFSVRRLWQAQGPILKHGKWGFRL